MPGGVKSISVKVFVGGTTVAIKSLISIPALSFFTLYNSKNPVPAAQPSKLFQDILLVVGLTYSAFNLTTLTTLLVSMVSGQAVVVTILK